MGHSGALIYSCLFLLVIISNLGVQGLSVDDLWDEVGEEIEKIFTQDGIDGARDINFDLGLYGIESGRHVTEGDIKHPKGHYLGGEYTVKKWPNGKIYYALDSRYKGDAWNQIALAMKTLQTYTCLRFVPIDSSTQDYVYFTRAGGCHSMLGKVGGKQIISLDVGCLDVGTIIHELMHAAGFIHEHARQDRDDYVRIVWSNIKEGLASQFEKESGVLHHSHTPYDYSSIMHYRRNSFSNNGQATIEPKHSREATHMGQNEGPTELDIRKINLAYGCQRKQTKTPTLPEPTQEVNTVNEDCQNSDWYNCDAFGDEWFCRVSESSRKHCPKSCGTCNGNKMPPQQPEPQSNAKRCPGMKSQEECDQYARDGTCYRYQYNDCRATCGSC